MAGAGGFVIPLTPPKSTVSDEDDASLLPRPGSRPFRSSEALVQHIDRRLLHISRRYEKRSTPAEGDVDAQSDGGAGYVSFTEMCNDLNRLIDDVWASGTPKMQTSTLLSLALTSCTSLSAFPFAARASVHLFRKLDEAFYSLLTSTIWDNGEPLPGSDSGKIKPTITEMIRLRGIVERTRIAVVEVAGRGEDDGSESRNPEARLTETTDDDEEQMSLGDQDTNDVTDIEMGIARVYERTISQLGQHLSSM